MAKNPRAHWLDPLIDRLCALIDMHGGLDGTPASPTESVDPLDDLRPSSFERRVQGYKMAEAARTKAAGHHPYKQQGKWRKK